MPFRHEALLYSGAEELTRRLLPYVLGGIDADEGVMVAMGPRKLGALQAALGSRAGEVEYIDMTVLGRNPARILPAWHRFVEAGDGRPLRGVGEPIWSGRTNEELVESQLHEALINLALESADNLTVVCPYDVSALPESVIHEACCSHPHVSGIHGAGPSEHYRDVAVHRLFDQPLPPPTHRAEVLGIDRTTLADVRRLVGERAREARLGPLKQNGIVLAVHELAANSLRHGGGNGVLRVWHEGDALLCEVKDRGHIRDRLVGRRDPGPDQIGGRGLWLVNQLCDLVQIRSSPQGTAVRVAMHPDGAEAAAGSLPAD